MFYFVALDEFSPNIYDRSSENVKLGSLKAFFLRAKIYLFYLTKQSLSESAKNWLRSVLGSQLFSVFWIGWMIEHPTKSTSKSSKKKSKKVWIFGFLLDLNWIIGLNWIFLIQSNNPI
jgi:hypothetical protein